MRILLAFLLCALAGCSAPLRGTLLSSVQVLESTRPLAPGTFQIGPRVNAEGCDYYDKDFELRDLLAKAKGSHDAMIEVVVEKVDQVTYYRGFYGGNAVVTNGYCYRVSGLAVDLVDQRTDTSGEDESIREFLETDEEWEAPSNPKLDAKQAPRVVEHPGWAALAGWRSYAWGGPIDDALKLVEPIGRMQSYRIMGREPAEIWGREVAKLRLNFRDGKLVQVTLKVSVVDGSRAELVAHLTEQLGPPTRDEDKDTRWIGEGVEVRLIGAAVTMNYRPLWHR